MRVLDRQEILICTRGLRRPSRIVTVRAPAVLNKERQGIGHTARSPSSFPFNYWALLPRYFSPIWPLLTHLRISGFLLVIRSSLSLYRVYEFMRELVIAQFSQDRSSLISFSSRTDSGRAR